MTVPLACSKPVRSDALALVLRLIDDLVPSASNSLRMSRVPSVLQSSTRMISFGNGTASTRLADPLPLVVDRDDDRQLETVRDRIDGQLPAGGLAQKPREAGPLIRIARQAIEKPLSLAGAAGISQMGERRHLRLSFAKSRPWSRSAGSATRRGCAEAERVPRHEGGRL